MKETISQQQETEIIYWLADRQRYIYIHNRLGVVKLIRIE